MAITTRTFVSNDTGNRGTELREFAVDEVTWRLNGIHSAKISCHPLAADALLVQLNEMEITIVLGEGFSHLFQGVPRLVSGGVDRIVFDVEGVASYLMDAYILDTDKVYNNVEQMNIATQLVTYAQAATDADRNILIGTYSNSGVLRTKTYLAEEYLNIFEVISRFPELDDGFDWDIVISGDGSRRFTPYYPLKGSTKLQYPISFDTVGASQWWRGLRNWKEDGYNQNTDVLITGPTPEGDATKMRGRWEASAPNMTLYGRKQVVFNESGAVSQEWLDDAAAAVGLATVLPQVLPEIDVSDELFGLIWHGDSIPVNINYGRIQVDDLYRIFELTLRPGDGTMSIPLQVA